MKKTLNWILSLAFIGTLAGLVIFYLRKNKDCDCCCDECCDTTEDPDDDDFDLDHDLQPVSEREYVPLNKTAEDNTKKEAAEEDDKKEAPAKAEAEKKADEPAAVK